MKKALISKHNRISDNKGSTLITVIVAIAFVTILTSIILGTTVVNVRMKGIDSRTKDDFYYAERSLNDIFTGLGQELAIEAGKQYELAFEKVGTDFDLAEKAEREFHTEFMTKAKDLMDSLTVDKLEEYILPASRGHVAGLDGVVIQKKDGSSASGISEAYRVVLKNVQVYVEDATGFRSTIATDMVVTLPTVDFLGTNADVSDYGLIANKGLYINGNCSINGNVYAGVHETANSQDADFAENTDKYARGEGSGSSYKGLFGGINIKDGKATFDGNYIISKGDINLSGSDPKIKVSASSGGAGGNLANLWFTSMRTITNRPGGKGAIISNASTEPTIDINANIFALNDTVLNADNSSAVIKGNYYGYNEGGLTNILQKKSGRDDGGNSAIIVNGNKVSLDMKDVDNFVLMGKAYIDFTSGDATDANNTGTQVVPTAESVALKTNQQLYLVPPAFLDGPNPVEDSADSHAFNINVSDTELGNWFGYKYIDQSVKHRSYKVALTGGSNAFYDYLVFDESSTWKPQEVSTLGTDDANNVYIVKKKQDGTGYEFVKYTRSTDPLGTGGSVSSKAMFFLKIMMSETAYEYEYSIHSSEYSDLNACIEDKEASKMQPSEYRLRDRINLSMSNPAYFDLGQCIVGDASADAHYYAKNAVINYEKVTVDRGGGVTEDVIQSNVLDNTEGMLRYSNYTENLFKRYILLCTRLDGQEKKLLEDDPTEGETIGGVPINVNNPSHWPDWTMTSSAPLSHLVKTSNIEPMNIGESLTSTSDPPETCANSEGLKPGAFGVVIATNGPLTIDTTLPTGAIIGNTFKGVAIVNGDITVGAGIDVDGLLMATGTITLNGNNNINYDKGLIQSRIEKEMNLVRNKDDSTTDTYKGKKGYMNYYLISYLSEDKSGTTKLIYDVELGSKVKRDRIDADYNDFIFFENWQKGEK